MFERTMSQGRDPNRSDAQTDNTGEKGGTSRRRLLASGAATWATVAIFFQGENPAVYGGREADNSLTFHRRLQSEYPTTANLY